MKKLFVLLALITILTACNQQAPIGEENNAASEEQTEDEAKNVKTETPPTNTLIDENFVEEGPLLEVGQWTKTEGGSTLTLKSITEPTEIYNNDLFSLSIDAIKLLEYSNVSEDERIAFEEYAQKKLNDTFHTIQINYTFTNNSEKEVYFPPVETITTNTQKQMDLSNSLAGDYIYDFKPNVKFEGYYIFPYFDDVSHLNEITVYSASLYYLDGKTTSSVQHKFTLE